MNVEIALLDKKINSKIHIIKNWLWNVHALWLLIKFILAQSFKNILEDKRK